MDGDSRVHDGSSSVDVGRAPSRPRGADRLVALWDRDGARFALLVFDAAVFGAAAWWLYLGRNQQLLKDEWFFVTSHGLGAHELFAPYNAHWTTLPILAYRLLWGAVGMRSYVPYLAVTVGLQLTTAILLRIVMRRIDVNPWIATLAASLFLFFGAGAQNVLWAFQMAFVGSLVFGLVQLLLADHEGHIDWRDGVGLVAGLAALMCSDVGVAMVVAVGVASMVRRGWRAAALHTLPLAAIFSVWWIVTEDWGRYHLGEGPVVLRDVASFVITGAGATFGGLVQVPGVAWIAAAVVGVGTVLAWTQTATSDRRRRFAMPVALVIGMLFFLVITGIGRAHEGAAHAREGRYLHIQAAMLLPLLALAADALVRRWRILVPLVVALFLVGIPGNLALGNTYVRSTRQPLTVAHTIISVGRLPVTQLLPREYPIGGVYLPAVTVGWILDLAHSGRLSTSGGLAPRRASATELRLSLAAEYVPPSVPCQPLIQPVTLQLATHEALATHGGGVTVTNLAPTNGVQASVALGVGNHVVRAVQPLTLRFASTSSAAPAQLCRA